MVWWHHTLYNSPLLPPSRLPPRLLVCPAGGEASRRRANFLGIGRSSAPNHLSANTPTGDQRLHQMHMYPRLAAGNDGQLAPLCPLTFSFFGRVHPLDLCCLGIQSISLLDEFCQPELYPSLPLSSCSAPFCCRSGSCVPIP